MTDTRYFVASDSEADTTGRDIALWRGASLDDDSIKHIAYKFELDYMDEALWPALVEGLHALTKEQDELLRADVRDMYAVGTNDARFAAIRHYRKLTGAGIREGTEAVERICGETAATR